MDAAERVKSRALTPRINALCFTYVLNPEGFVLLGVTRQQQPGLCPAVEVTGGCVGVSRLPGSMLAELESPKDGTICLPHCKANPSSKADSFTIVQLSKTFFSQGFAYSKVHYLQRPNCCPLPPQNKQKIKGEENKSLQLKKKNLSL